MKEPADAGISELIKTLLKDRGISGVRSTDALFSSGLLDSIAATDVLMALESDFGVDLADEDFDILQIDTLDSITAFVAARQAA